MKLAISVKLAFGVLALYLSIPASIMAVQSVVAQQSAAASRATVAAAR